MPLYQEERNEATLELIQSGLDEVAFAEAWQTGASLSLEEVVVLAIGELDEPSA